MTMPGAHAAERIGSSDSMLHSRSTSATSAPTCGPDEIDTHGYERLALAVLTPLLSAARANGKDRRHAITFLEGEGRLWCGWCGVEADTLIRALEALERTQQGAPAGARR
jgi:hypothetical protein